MILTHGANSIDRGDENIIYETDFSNFDFANKIDYPKIGEEQEYTYDSSAFELSNVVIDGKTYNSLHHTTGNKNIFTQFYNTLHDVELFSVEVMVYKPSMGTTTTNNWAYMEFFNETDKKQVGSPSFQNERTPNGYGVVSSPNYGTVDWVLPSTYVSANTMYVPSDADLKGIDGICRGGVTVDKNNKKLKVFLKNKKFMIVKNIQDMEYNRMSFWFGSIVDIYLLGIRITRNDIFETKE